MLRPTKKHYRILNWTFLGLVCYVAALPAVKYLTSLLFPQLWQCAYRSLTGIPCPFCESTGDIARLWQGNFEFGNPMTPYLLPVIGFELIWRGALLCFPRAASRKIMIADLIVHIFLLLFLAGVYLALNFG